MVEQVTLTPDELLATTRAVRKRLDLKRAVPRDLLLECFRLAQQAPNGGNREEWGFVVVRDPKRRDRLAELYRREGNRLLSPQAVESRVASDLSRAAETRRRDESARYLVDRMHEVPVLVIPCVRMRSETMPGPGGWASVIQATWSFMLAARARGLGTAWTSMHLAHEQEAAEVLGIPFPSVRQAALIPVAYAIGTTFKPGIRRPVEEILHWESWQDDFRVA